MHVRDIGRTEPKIYRVFIAITLLPLLRSDGHDAKADAAQKEHKNSTTVRVWLGVFMRKMKTNFVWRIPLVRNLIATSPSKRF